MKTQIWLSTLLLCSSASASSIGSLATADIQCSFASNYRTPDGGTYSPEGGIRDITASGANAAAPSCAGFTQSPIPGLTPLGITIHGQSSASASGSANYGIIQGASSALDGLGGSLIASANYTGSFDDAITVTGGSGFARFVWVLTGRGVRQPGDFQTGGKSELYVDNALRSTLVLPATNGAQTFQYDRNFSSGDTIAFRAALTLPARSFDFATNSADLRLFIQFYQANGNPLTGLSVVSDSGTAYAESPEPATALLAAAGALLLGLGRRRR